MKAWVFEVHACLTSIKISVDSYMNSEFLVLFHLFNTDGKSVEEWETKTEKTMHRLRTVSLVYLDLKKCNSDLFTVAISQSVWLFSKLLSNYKTQLYHSFLLGVYRSRSLTTYTMQYLLQSFLSSIPDHCILFSEVFTFFLWGGEENKIKKKKKKNRYFHPQTMRSG